MLASAKMTGTQMDTNVADTYNDAVVNLLISILH